MECKGLSGRTYITMQSPFAGGGEGDIFRIEGNAQYVAKIYKLDKRTRERERKLSVMVANQPSVQNQYAWPIDVLYANGSFVGFVMPAISGKEKLRNIYVYDKRESKPWSLFIVIAKNLAAAVHNVHGIHQVIGDLNPENILVDPNNGMVTLVDTDSYHISDTSRTYRCMVGMPEFIAPELQGIHFPSAPLPTFTYSSDRFALSVLIFALLMNGAHPFSCRVIGESSSQFQPIDNMQKGCCAYFSDSHSYNLEIPRYSPELSALPDNLQLLFRRAFVLGLNNPTQRPSAEEWYHALEQLEDNLKICTNDSSHLYYYGLQKCPWCEVALKMRAVVQTPLASSNNKGTVLNSAHSNNPVTYHYVPSSATASTLQKANSSNPPPKKKSKLWIIVLVCSIIALIVILSNWSSCYNCLMSPTVNSYDW